MALFESQVKNDKTYQEHKVFNLLDSLIEFYNAEYKVGPDFVTRGVFSGMLNIDHVVCASLSGTLDSVRAILIEGRINDAYALVRKYYDGIVVGIYVNVYLAENFSMDNYIVEKIQNWVDNKEKLPSYETMLKVIRNHQPLQELEKLFDWDGLYHRIRRLSNGNTHYNKLYYMWLNNNMIYYPKRVKELDNIYSCVQHLFILHFAYMYSLNPEYMMSSDYVDALDLGQNPEEGSQYWVATYVSEVFEGIVKPKRPDIAEYMKAHTEMYL